MTTALAMRQGDGGHLVSSELGDTLKLGEILAKSGFFSDTKEAAQAVTKILAGRELGIPPVAAMTGIYIVKGKVSLSANLIAGQIKRSGKYDYRVRFTGNTACTITFFQDGQSVGETTFSQEDAQAAGLTGNPTWKAFPRNMLFARALSNGARWYCPDVFSGPVYTPDEMGLAVDAEGDVVPEPARITVLQGVPPHDAETGEIVEPEPTREPAKPPVRNEGGKELTRRLKAALDTLGWNEGQSKAWFALKVADGTPFQELDADRQRDVVEALEKKALDYAAAGASNEPEDLDF